MSLLPVSVRNLVPTVLEAADPELAAATELADAATHASTPQLGFNPQLSKLTQTMRELPAANAAPASFASQLAGTTPEAIDMQMAQLASDVYDPSNAGSDGWTRLSDDQLRQAGIDPSTLETPSTGFRAGIYQDGKGDYVLAFAGSNDIPDWLNNISQGLGLPSAQYAQAAALATQAKVAFGDQLAITGHSLGGGLASIASLATDTPAVTFNASGLDDNTIKQLVPDADVDALKQQADNGLIRRYAIDGEALTTVQESTPLPDAVGHKIELHDPSPVAKPDIHWYDWLDGKGEALEAQYAIDVAKHPIDLHMTDAVLAAMAKDHPWTS
ncbi:hypothetical protein [Dyella sp.]|uniref:hypothetical protein n=1 Tax=Dyella sp. TaxID=1869338 RepID=UPI002ED465D4